MSHCSHATSVILQTSMHRRSSDTIEVNFLPNPYLSPPIRSRSSGMSLRWLPRDHLARLLASCSPCSTPCMGGTYYFPYVQGSGFFCYGGDEQHITDLYR